MPHKANNSTMVVVNNLIVSDLSFIFRRIIFQNLKAQIYDFLGMVNQPFSDKILPRKFKIIFFRIPFLKKTYLCHFFES
jgi:hypothetical protein